MADSIRVIRNIRSRKACQVKKYFYRWGPAVVLMGLIFLASSTSGSDIPDFGRINFFIMKFGHMIGYALLGASYFHGLSYGRSLTRTQVIAAGILVLVYAATDEWHQRFTPDRHPALMDIGIDVLGGFLGITSLRLIRRRLWCGS